MSVGPVGQTGPVGEGIAPWGEAGSFLLPRCLREALDPTEPPGDVLSGYLPLLKRDAPLASARIPRGWVYLQGVARELLPVARRAEFHGLHVVTAGVLDHLVDTDGALELLTAAFTDQARDGVVSRAVASIGKRHDSAGSLIKLTLDRLWTAAGHDAQAWLTSATEVDRLLALSLSATPSEPLVPASPRSTALVEWASAPVFPVPGRKAEADPPASRAALTADLLTVSTASAGGSASSRRSSSLGRGPDLPPLWGDPGTPLLPLSLERGLAGVELSPDVVRLAGLVAGARVGPAARIGRSGVDGAALARELMPLLKTQVVRHAPAVAYDTEGSLRGLDEVRRQLLHDIESHLRFPLARGRVRGHTGATDDLAALSGITVAAMLRLDSVSELTLLTLAVGTEQLLRHRIGPGQLQMRRTLETLDTVAENTTAASHSSGLAEDRVARLLTTDMAVWLASLEPGEWLAVFSRFPTRPHNALLRSTAGDIDAVRSLLLSSTSEELGKIRHIGRHSVADLLHELGRAMSLDRRAATVTGTLPLDSPSLAGDVVSFAPEPFLPTADRDALAGLGPRSAQAFLAALQPRHRNALLWQCGSVTEAVTWLAEATVADVLGLRQHGPKALSALQASVVTLIPEIAALGLDNMAGTSCAAVELVPPPPQRKLEPQASAPVPAEPELFRIDDPRFADLLEPWPDLAQRLEALVHESVGRTEQLLRALQDRQELFQARTVEEEAIRLLAAAMDLPHWHERVAVVGTRFGLAGARPATLDEAGQMLGITRERVRQLQRDAERRLPQARVWAPLMDQLVQLVDVLVPCSVKDLNEALREADISDMTWSWPGLVAAAGLTGRGLDQIECNGLILDAAHAQGVKAVLQSARKMSERNGAANVDHVKLSQGGSSALAADVTLSVLRESDDVRWLADGWFWTAHANNRNRLVNTALRILAVQAPQTLQSVLGGVKRNFAWRNSSGGDRTLELEVPPPHVVLEFFRSHPAFIVDGQDLVSAAVPLDVSSLGPEKATLVAVLREQPFCAMTRNDLLAACAAQGMQTSTVSVFLTYGECITSHGHNVWGLRGVPVPSRVVADLQERARETTRQFDRNLLTGVTEGGRPWFAMRLSPSVLYSGVVTGRVARQFPQDSTLTIIDGVDGEPAGQLKRSGDFLYGLTQVLGKHRGAAGDCLRVVSHSGDGYASVEIGQDELLEAPEDW